MRDGGKPPRDDEFELTLLGPGYGESIVMHVGDGAWVLVDSCGRADAPTALHYLETLGIDPADAVEFIVATHWHDDHIRGIARMVDACNTATFCCGAALRAEEFLAAVHELEHRHFAAFGSGVQEIYKLFSRHREKGVAPTWALANRRVFSNGACHIWSLSPADDTLLDSMRALLPSVGQAETRIRSLSPNEVAVVLWIEVGLRTTLERHLEMIVGCRRCSSTAWDTGLRGFGYRT